MYIYICMYIINIINIYIYIYIYMYISIICLGFYCFSDWHDQRRRQEKDPRLQARA